MKRIHSRSHRSHDGLDEPTAHKPHCSTVPSQTASTTRGQLSLWSSPHRSLCLEAFGAAALANVRKP
jgi:hypothetical protein